MSQVAASPPELSLTFSVRRAGQLERKAEFRSARKVLLSRATSMDARERALGRLVGLSQSGDDRWARRAERLVAGFSRRQASDSQDREMTWQEIFRQEFLRLIRFAAAVVREIRTYARAITSRTPRSQRRAAMASAPSGDDSGPSSDPPPADAALAPPLPNNPELEAGLVDLIGALVDVWLAPADDGKAVDQLRRAGRR